MKLTRLILLFTLLANIGCIPSEKTGGSGEEGSTSVSLKLSWQPPASRVNGDRLYAYEIGGYEIVYQNLKWDPDEWKSIVVFDDQSYILDEHTIEGLEPGEYAVSISCFDIDGLYSEFSEAAYVDKR